VRGASVNGEGVFGQGGTNGVHGRSAATRHSGVWGENTGSGFGVAGSSNNGTGVFGKGRIGVDASGDIGMQIFGGQIGLVIKAAQPADFIQAYQGPDRIVFRVDNDGRVHTGGADVAEFIVTSGAPQPGDVVVIDPNHPGQFSLATTPNSTAVAGVISTLPGMVMNSKQSGQSRLSAGPQLALAGRVPVKASAENGAIRPGDLLVTSSTPGRAMRAPTNPIPGTVLGKALGNLDRGVCAIEMLVMLR